MIRPDIWGVMGRTASSLPKNLVEAVDRAISSGVKRGLNRLIKTAIFHINFGGRIYVDISGLAVCVDLVKLVRETVKEETDHELLSDLRSALQNALKLMD